jgi:hypothetical protein
MNVGVSVGVSKALVHSEEEHTPENEVLRKPRGNVVVRADERVDEWLINLQEPRQRCHVSQVIVVFHATTREPWFHLLDAPGWTCDTRRFVLGPGQQPTAVEYLSEQHRGIGLAMRCSRMDVPGSPPVGSSATHRWSRSTVLH